MAQESWKREQEETACQTPEGPVLCVSNCGFFGSATTMGMCSKCYRDWVLKQAKTSPGKSGDKGGSFILPGTGVEVVSGVETPKMESGAEMMALDESFPTTTGAAVTSAAKAAQESKLQPNRCFTCKKRVGLTGFKCRCERMFCSSHRHSDQHNCPYDYKAAGRDAIAKANPVVKAEKIDKI